MADASGNSTPKDRRVAPLAPAVRVVPDIGTSVQANLAVLQAKNVLGAQFKDLAAQMTLLSSRYADLFAGMSTAAVFAQASAAQRTATADIAALALVRSPAWTEATRGLSKSLEIQQTSALSKMLSDIHASGALADVTARWAAQQQELLGAAKLQLSTLSRSLLADPARDALLGSIADLGKSVNLGVANSLAVHGAGSLAARSVMVGLSEQLRSAGTGSASWQRLFQNLQLADGIGSIARLTATPGPLLRSQTLALGAGSYASVQRVLGDLARDRDAVLLRGRSLLPAVTLNSYFDSLGARPWHRRAELAGLVGNATSGLVLGESLTAELDDDDADLLVATATTDVIEPWQDGFDETRAALFAALEALSPHLANLLRGAWFNIKANGPAAAASAANCLTEVLDQTLHALVDESLLPAWLSEHGRLGREYIDEKSGRPTRRARLAYALQARSKRDAQLLRGLEAGLVASLSPLHSQLESGKHGRVDIGVQAVGCHAVALESFLINLLLGGE
jgi:hypothetical protein